MTEYGACGVALLLILKLTSFTVIERARKGTGVDYWLGYRESEYPFQQAARLEVSGILDGDDRSVETRLRRKIKQTQPSKKSGLPAYVIIVEFGCPQSRMVEK